jgi:phage terminase large subunit-like protein
MQLFAALERDRRPSRARVERSYRLAEMLHLTDAWWCGQTVEDRSPTPAHPHWCLAHCYWHQVRKLREGLIEASGTRSRRRLSPATHLPASERRAAAVIEFIEKLIIPSGIGEGRPLVLMPWQRAFVRDIYRPHLGGRRLVRRAILSVARKQGKTALTAALALAHLIGPEAIVNGEIYSCANDRDQAGICFKFARQMVERDPRLKEMIDLVPSTKTMAGRSSGSVYRAVSRESSTKHGYAPSVVIYDELAQSKGRELYDVFDTSFGARNEPLFVAISTQSNDTEHILSRLIDDGLAHDDPTIVCHLHAADEGCALDDEKEWKKANPALGVFRDAEDLATAIRKAMRMPAEEPKVRNLFPNQRVEPSAPLLARAEWMACAGDATLVSGERVYLALDMAQKLDTAALAIATVADPVRAQVIFWKPAATLAEHSRRDFGVGNDRYGEWAHARHLRLSPGRSIDPEIVATEIADLDRRFQVQALAFDRWGTDELWRECDRIGLRTFVDGEKGGSGLRIVPWGQGYRGMSRAIDTLEVLVFERRLVHPNSPCLNWHIGNAVATTDPAGNRKMDKEKAKFRIDGAVALAMAVGLRASDRNAPTPIDISTLIA